MARRTAKEVTALKSAQRRHRVVYLADLCSCGHERHMHLFASPTLLSRASPPNFGRWHCERCTCPMFVLDAAMTKANKELFGDVLPRPVRG